MVRGQVCRSARGLKGLQILRGWRREGRGNRWAAAGMWEGEGAKAPSGNTLLKALGLGWVCRPRYHFSLIPLMLRKIGSYSPSLNVSPPVRVTLLGWDPPWTHCEGRISGPLRHAVSPFQCSAPRLLSDPVLSAALLPPSRPTSQGPCTPVLQTAPCSEGFPGLLPELRRRFVLTLVTIQLQGSSPGQHLSKACGCTCAKGLLFLQASSPSKNY